MDWHEDWRLYHFPDKPYRHEFVDLVRFNTDGKIAQIKEFQDTKLIHTHWNEHQSSPTKE